jgi:hypothetical protein
MKRIIFVALLGVAALGLTGYATAQTNSHAPRPYYVSPDQPEQGVPPDDAGTASDDPNSPVQGGSADTYGSGNAGSPGAAGTTGSPSSAGTAGTPGSTTGSTGTTMDPNDPNNPNYTGSTTGKTPRTDRHADANRLPATAGEMPLIALIGVLAAGLFFALRLFRTRPIEFRG